MPTTSLGLDGRSWPLASYSLNTLSVGPPVHAFSVGLALILSRRSQTSQSRSILAWCTQNIGSTAAVIGELIRPPSPAASWPPTSVCTWLWGRSSSQPLSSPELEKGVVG